MIHKLWIIILERFCGKFNLLFSLIYQLKVAFCVLLIVHQIKLDTKNDDVNDRITNPHNVHFKIWNSNIIPSPSIYWRGCISSEIDLSHKSLKHLNCQLGVDNWKLLSKPEKLLTWIKMSDEVAISNLTSQNDFRYQQPVYSLSGNKGGIFSLKLKMKKK